MLFSKKDHKYFEDGVEYESVTKFLKQFEPKFETELIAGKFAVKNKRDVKDVLDEWDLNAQVSQDYGNALHKGLEMMIRFGKAPNAPHIQKVALGFCEKYDREQIKTEIVVHSKKHKLAGRIDHLHLLGDKKVGITDLKTNGDLDKKPFGNFLFPFNDLPKTKINKYRLQLSTYKHLLELKGFQVEWLKLEHWDGEKLNTIELEPVDMKVVIK